MQDFQRSALQKELAAASPETIARLAWDWCKKNATDRYMRALMEKQHKEQTDLLLSMSPLEHLLCIVHCATLDQGNEARIECLAGRFYNAC